MRLIKRFLILYLVGWFACPVVWAEDLYLAATAAGDGTGSSCSNALEYSFFNTAGNWGAGAGKISAGDTVHLCGTFIGDDNTTLLTAKGSGSAGNPITIKFEPGARLSGTYWPHTNLTTNGGAITINGYDYFIIDGSPNGIIENTDNGYGLGHQAKTSAIGILHADNIEIKNLTLQNLYQTVDGELLNPANYGPALYFYDSSHVSAHDLYITYSGQGIYHSSRSNTDVDIYNDRMFRVGQSVVADCAADGYGSDDVRIHDLVISYAIPWDYNDGIKTFCRPSTDDQFTKLKVYNNSIGPGIGVIGGRQASGHIFVNAAMYIDPLIYNNLVLGDASENVSGYINCGGPQVGYWQPNYNYGTAHYVHPRTVNGHKYHVTTDNGSSGSVEPTWPTGSGETVADGGLVWTENGSFTLVDNNCGIYNNTIYTLSLAHPLFYISYYNRDVDIRSNVVYAPNMSTSTSAIYLDPDCTMAMSDYNVWFITGGDPRFHEEGTNKTFTSWKAAHPTFDLHSSLSDPALDASYNATASTPIGPDFSTYYTTDRFGTIRSNWTAGQNEYSGEDVVPPVVTAFILGVPSGLTVPISGFTATDGVGATGYCVNETVLAPTNGSCDGSGWAGSAQASYTFASYGSKTLYAWAKDAAGNVSAGASATVRMIPATAVTIGSGAHTMTIGGTKTVTFW